MPFGQTKIRPISNKSSIVKNAQPTMNKFSDLSQVAAINFKLAKAGKSFIPSVPVNYSCPKQQKPGKSLIPRYMVNNPKKVENGKPSPLSHVKKISHVNLKKDKTLALVKHRRSYIPRKVAKNVKTLSLSRNVQEKPQPTSLFGKFGKSKIPVLISAISTKKTKKTKKANVATRTSHSRTCAICSPAKKENARVSRFNANRDDQVRVEIKEIKTIKTQTQVLTFNIIKNDDVPSRIPTPASIKRSLIPVRSLTNNLFKKRVSPMQLSMKPSIQPSTQPSTQPSMQPSMQPSILTSVSSIKQEELESISTITSSNKYQIIAQDFNKKTNSYVCFSLENKYTQLQKSVNKPGASITISHSQVEVSTITSFIKPELSSISLLYKAEKDLSGTRHQIEGNNNEDESPSLFDNVIKSIVRFSKNLFSKML